MSRFFVKLKKNSYPIDVGNGILKKISPSFKNYNSVCIVSDTNVAPLYLETVKNELLKTVPFVCEFVFKAGEKSKNLTTFGEILSFLAENTFTRSDALVALGGGVVGDLTGFVAASYCRGIDFYQIPTTLLSMIDSSVGGKTAVDLPNGKNLVGAFYQPKHVFVDIDTLKTLPHAEIVNGNGELVKHGLLAGGELWEELKSENLDIKKCIELSVQYKASIVQKDEKEHGERIKLNLGHTLAHSIEKLSDYTVPHGLAVGYGLREVVLHAKRVGNIDDALFKEINEVLNKFELTYTPEYSMKEMCEVAKLDKKSRGNEINVVEFLGFGESKASKIPLDELEKYFND